MASETDARKFPISDDGKFVRPPSTFTNKIEKGGKFEPEKDRYHLYVAYVCPWAGRTLIARNLKGLQDIVSVTVCSSRMDSKGWRFDDADPDFPGSELDPLYGSSHIRDLYFKAEPNFNGRFTVPVLWDKKLETIVNNESSEIIRIFNTAFNELLPEEYAKLDLYPEDLRGEIDSLNEWMYNDVNNGVYRSGFARSQEAYEGAVKGLFEGLDRTEKILADGSKTYLVGDRLTEADVRLFVTAVSTTPSSNAIPNMTMFYTLDPIRCRLSRMFKCNIRNIRHGYPNINRWMKNLYWNNKSFSEPINFQHIKASYYHHPAYNPTGIHPVGPIPAIEAL
ncbi:S-glutathionyl-(chloro)hydroquinone reductase [Marasmius tenuissimus]|uniref:S-glutathionyl-(Chloro)hydroquinone reductase n=1 Tax=Marasmius tenuissimus TaxID=585030 RepID=A0ABR2ZA28_9AGAR